ncbi:MAG: TonB-dependent receptor [Acidobacteria bacterium]|nr:TonB-dependent receptor [Acidobacteriota bacterium]
MLKGTSCKSLCALLLALVMAFSAVSTLAQSQASSGQIVGTVTDAQGAALAGAKVKAVNKQTGLTQNATTDDEGLFRIVLLPPGSYEVTIEAAGFSKATANVEVTVGRTAEVKLPLSTSGVQEIVNVTAGAVQVQTTRSEADAVIGEKAIENLPINGRRFQDFVTLTPGAQVDPRRGQISLSGQLGIHTNVNVDGVDYNQPFFGGIRGGERSNNAFTIPQEAIKEFQVVASGYSAEFGRSTGGIVNAVTKSGTNSYHGSAFYLGRPEKLSRQNDFIKAVEQSVNSTPGAPKRSIAAAPTQHQFGGSIGGPIKKDKLFFFGAYEQQRLRQKREVQFPALLSVTPTADQLEAYNYFTSLQTPFTQTNDAIALLGRVDYEISNNHRMNIRYSYSTNEALNAVSNGVPLFPTINNALSNNGTEKDRTHTVVGQLASFFSSNLVNEFRGQYSRETRPRLANAQEPTVEVGPIGRFGTVSFLDTTQFDWRVQLADSLTFTRGSHSVKFGGEYNHVFQDQLFGFNQNGRFTLGGGTAAALDILSVGGPKANRFDDSSVTFLKQVGNLKAAYTTREVAFFGQDAWRVIPNLTINFGLRWEAQYNPSPELGNTALINLIKGVRFPSGHVADPTQIPDDTNNFGPRLGFAWDPTSNGKTVIRGYGGIYYSRTPGLLLSTPTNNFRTPAGDLPVRLPFSVPMSNPNKTVYQQLKLIGIDLNNFALGKLPIITVEQIQQIAARLGVDPGTAGISPLFFAKDYANPKSVQGGIGIERELTRGLTVGADFSYVNTTHLQQNRDLNLPIPVPRATDPAKRPFYTRNAATTPIPGLSQIQVRETVGRSLYRALTLRSKFQRSWGLFNAFYTLSKTLSNTDNEREAGGVQYDDAFDTSSEYGPSNLDRRHQFTASPVFYLPFGIDLAAALRLRSGRPINATVPSDANGDGNFNDRPYRAAGIPYERNAFRNRALYDVDLRVQKRIQLSENKRLLFTAEVFNILNLNNIELAGSTVTNYCSSPTKLDCGFLAPDNPNFLSLTEKNPTNARFGKLLLSNNSGSPFQVQLGARFQF